MLDNFWGNAHVAQALEQMIGQQRLAQTLLFSGPEGIGKATLARRLGARLLGHADWIEKDDLSLPDNLEIVSAREKWTAEKRNEDPLLFASHPDFITFAPDGPLRQISIPQTRLLKERAQFMPHRGSRRVFLIDGVDRANEQAANSLLKTLEEPPDHLVVIMTAANAYDLLPTIRSRAVPFQLAPLSVDEMQEFVRARGLDRPERRLALAAGSPGAAVSLDIDAHDRRRAAMLALLKAAAGAAPFGTWAPVAGSDWAHQKREAGAAPEGALRTIARSAGIAAGRGRDPQPGYPRGDGNAGRQSGIRMDPQGLWQRWMRSPCLARRNIPARASPSMH